MLNSILAILHFNKLKNITKHSITPIHRALSVLKVWFVRKMEERTYKGKTWVLNFMNQITKNITLERYKFQGSEMLSQYFAKKRWLDQKVDFGFFCYIVWENGNKLWQPIKLTESLSFQSATSKYHYHRGLFNLERALTGNG